MRRDKEKDFRDNDGDSAKERLFESSYETVEDYARAFDRLQIRAEQHGIASTVVLSVHDPLTGYSGMKRGSRGGYYQNLGAMDAALTEMRQD